MKVLIYGNRKQDDMMWDASTPEKEKAALRQLFECLDESWQVYGEIKDTKEVKRQEKKVEELREAVEEVKNGKIPKALEAAGRNNAVAYERAKREFASLKEQNGYYEAAKNGDDKALKILLQIRKGYEYEEWDYGDVIDPLESKKRR